MSADFAMSGSRLTSRAVSRDPLGTFLRRTPPFPGKEVFQVRWLKTRTGRRTRTLDGGFTLDLDMTVPYEATVWLGREEADGLAFLRRELGPGDVLVDCGANIGLWALSGAAAVGTTGRVHAVEANPATAARLRAHAAQAPWITVHEVAAGAAPGEARFDAGGEHHNIARIAQDGGTVVPVARLDDLVDGPVTGMKLDVEGHELAALQGASRLLESRPWLVVEFDPGATGVADLGAWPVHGLLADAGYRPESLDGRPLDPGFRPRHGYVNVVFR